jgi:thioesterase domain-containing protein
MFFVHPAGGNVLCYANLIHHLGTERPFYGLQAQGLDGEQTPHTRLEEMAAHYLELIRTVQPEGPYLLGGWSLGGIVAFEMAQQLRAQGQAAALLALIDSHPPAGDPRPEANDLALLASFALDLGLPIHRASFDLADLGQTSDDERLTLVLQQAKEAGIVPPDVELAQIRRLFDVFKCNVRAMRRYAPRAYAGPIVLFKAQEALGDRPLAEDLGWGALAVGGLTVHESPGNHYTMMRTPNIEILAEQLKTQLPPPGTTMHKSAPGFDAG